MREFHSLRADELHDLFFDTELIEEEPRVKVEESKGKIEISLSFPGFFRSDDPREVRGREMPFSQINMASTGFLAENGRPLLPSFNRYVQIPANSEVSLRTRKGEPVEFDDVLVLPAQERLTDSPAEKDEFQYEREFYRRDSLYPRRMVEVKGPFLIDGYHAVLLTVVPFQYNPKKKKLIGYGELDVTLNIEPADRSEPVATFDPALDREAFGNFFLNPRRRVEERLETRPPRAHGRVLRERGPEFLIVYAEPFAAAAEKLALWKNRRGLRTQTKVISEIGNTVADLKSHLRGQRGFHSRLRYVLLLGDVEHIQAETIPGGPWGDNITDYYYSTPRDATGPEDVVLPWLSIGRIPVQDATDAMAVVNQIIRYEKSPPSEDEYYDNLTFAAYFQGDGTATRAYMKTMEAIRDHMVTLGFDVERVYVSQTPNVDFYVDGTPVPADVKAAIMTPTAATNALKQATNDGRLVAGHRDHGGRDGWSHPSFTKTHLDQVTTNVPTVFHSINCLTGMFDRPGATESFAEKLLRIDGGAPSLIAATRKSHTWLNNDLMKALFDGTWGGMLPTFPGSTASYAVRHNRLGDVLNYAKTYLPVAQGVSEFVKDHVEIYHVVGDPTLEIWQQRPARQRCKSWVTGNSLHIKLDRLAKDTVLTVWNDDQLIKRIEPTSNYIRVALPRERITELPWLRRLRTKLAVCLWAPNHRFRQVKPKWRPVAESVHFDWRDAKVEKIDNRWKIAVGDMALLDFGRKESEAQKALEVIHHYHLDQQCLIGKPQPSMEFYLADGASPVGPIRGEESKAFEPRSVDVKKVGGRWKLAENGDPILDFGSGEDEARAAREIIRRYGFNHICYVGKPKPSMVYFRN